MKKQQPPSYIKGTPEFISFRSALTKGSYLHKITEKGIDTLKRNMFAGAKVPKRLFPKYYVRKYRITNLYVLDLDGGYRLTYTILAEGRNKVVVILEEMSHTEYERRFGYH